MMTADLTAALAELEAQRPRPTVTDLFRLAQAHGVSAAFLLQAWENRGARPADQVRSDEAEPDDADEVAPLAGAFTAEWLMRQDFSGEPCERCGDADPVPGEDHCQACLNIIYGPLTDDDGTGEAK